LVIVHTGLASAVKTPELVIDEQEGGMLAGPLVDVLDQFDIKPDPKIEACIALVTACCAVYGPRIYTISNRTKREAKERAEPKQPGPFDLGNVTDIKTGSNGVGPQRPIMEPTQPIVN